MIGYNPSALYVPIRSPLMPIPAAVIDALDCIIISSTSGNVACKHKYSENKTFSYDNYLAFTIMQISYRCMIYRY